MDNQINMPTGELKMFGISFSFVFDGMTLKLIPYDPEDVFKLQYEEIQKGTYAYKGLPQIEENVLTGHCNENGQTIVFILPIGGSISSYNHVLEVVPLAYVKLRFSGKKISRLGFSCRELNHIYPISQAYRIKAVVCESSIEDFSIQTKKYSETKTDEQRFIQDGVDVKTYFSVGCSYSSSNDKAPLIYNSYLFFEFPETDDYLFLYKLCNTAYDFIRFMCYRSNICFTKIQISSPYKDNRFLESGEMIILRPINSEDYPIKRELFIRQQDIQGNEACIFQMIANEKLYLRHIPETFEIGNHITPAFFVMILAAFEWEYKQLFPNGVVKKQATVKAEDEVWETLDELLHNSSGKTKKLYKSLRDHVRDDNLAAKIQHVTKELKVLIDPFAKYLFSINKEEVDYNKMSDRLAEQRNNYAHGNLDREFKDIVVLDLMLLQKIVYIMQLKRSSVNDLRIKHAVKHLYHMNLEFEEDKEESVNNTEQMVISKESEDVEKAEV